MAIQQLPSGRFRATVNDPTTGKRVSVAGVLGLTGDDATFKNKTEAKRASAKASDQLAAASATTASPTVRAFQHRWLNDPLFARPKGSTMILYRDCTKGFVEQFGDLRLSEVDDTVVARWLAGGNRNYTVKALCAMFSDAASAKAGRLLAINPFAKLGVTKSYGNKQKQPPSEELVQRMIGAAFDMTQPSFGAWLQVACYTGMRPGELDALTWENVDLDAGWITVDRQFSQATRTITTPKNGQSRIVPMHAPAIAALVANPNDSEYCFVNSAGSHWSNVSRHYHWNVVRAAVGWTESLYLATRHFAGWMMYDQLLLPAEDVAFALGHTDNGDLVRKLYGHRDQQAALERVKRAFADRKPNLREAA